MVFVYVISMFIVLYFGVVWASYLKFKYNGIGLNFKYKFYMLLFPLFILYMHIRLSLKFFKKDKKKSMVILIYAFTKYPILIGNFIEITKESMAECDVYGNSRLLTLKKKEIHEKERNIRDVLFNIKDIFKHFKANSAYEREVLSGLQF